MTDKKYFITEEQLRQLREIRDTMFSVETAVSDIGINVIPQGRASFLLGKSCVHLLTATKQLIDLIIKISDQEDTSSLSDVHPE